jgi:hypothetical protein
MIQFERQTLTGVINKRPHKPGLFKELFFKKDRETLDTTTAEIHTVIGGKKLIPFVTDIEGGTLVDGTTREAQTVKTPRLRPKQVFSAAKLLETVKPGEPCQVKAGVTDDRVEAAIARDLQEVKDRCEITTEYMAASALCGGKIQASQDNIAFEIDFRMPATHIIVLGGGAQWGDAGVSILEGMQTWADLVLDSCGLTVDAMVCGINAHKLFRADAEVKAELDNRRIDLGLYSPMVGKAYQGHVQGVDIFRYGGTYQDEAGNLVKMMDPNYVLLGCTYAENGIVHGRPTDLECDGPTEYFTKSKIVEDPSQIEFINETRPLPWNKQPDAFVYVKVTG